MVDGRISRAFNSTYTKQGKSNNLAQKAEADSSIAELKAGRVALRTGARYSELQS